MQFAEVRFHEVRQLRQNVGTDRDLLVAVLVGSVKVGESVQEGKLQIQQPWGTAYAAESFELIAPGVFQGLERMPLLEAAEDYYRSVMDRAFGGVDRAIQLRMEKNVFHAPSRPYRLPLVDAAGRGSGW